MRARFAFVVPALALALTGCKSSCDSCTVDGDGADAQAAGFVNETCPASGNAIAASAGAAEFNGHKVGFCCPGCKEGWTEMADADKGAFVKKALAGNG